MIEVSDKTIAAIAFTEESESAIDLILEPMQGKIKRDWFVDHAYFCLPLTIGNQYGIGIRCLQGFTAIWTGGISPTDVMIEFDENDEPQNYQVIESHFGMGTITIQNLFTLRTPPGVNLMTINPPNTWIDGIQHMTGVVETDNLRRDFTFNLKITRPAYPIRVNKGDLIGCVLPVPRYFCDQFVVKSGKELFTEEQLQEERDCMESFGKERREEDPKKKHGNGRRYYNGEDVYGNKFKDHQKAVKIPK